MPLALPSLHLPRSRNVRREAGSQSARVNRKVSSKALPRLPPQSAREFRSSEASWRQETPLGTPWDDADADDFKFGVSRSTATSWSPALQATLREWNAPAARLQQGDLIANGALREHFRNMRLGDFFDLHGSPHFEQLGLTVAARQNAQVASSFGSQSDLHERLKSLPPQGLQESEGVVMTKGKIQSFLAASEAFHKDLAVCRRKAKELLSSIRDEDRMRKGEVDDRRLGLLFQEFPDFQQLLPHTVKLPDLIPADLTEEEESYEKSILERQNSFLEDKRNWYEGSMMNWVFEMYEVLDMAPYLERWSVSTRGSNMPMGIDRATFCRLLLDLNLVEQERVPYFWAVKLFDSLAQTTRCAPPGAPHAATAPLQPVVNHFKLISLLDTLVRQTCDANKRSEIITRIVNAEQKLPLCTEDRPPPRPKTASSQQDLGDDGQDDEVGLQTSEEEARLEFSSPKPDSPSPAASDKDWKSSVDREQAYRERLLCCQLCEPEVLHLVCIYRTLFTSLFECYAPEGHMEYNHLLRFCVDFHMSPHFVTEDSLKGAFESVQCYKLQKRAPIPIPISVPWGKLRRKTRVLVSMSRGSISRGSISRQTSGGKSAESSETTDILASGTSTPSGSASLNPPSAEYDARFDADSFLEAICKVTFLHLGFYGNAVQQCSSSYYKMSWLLAHLRHVLTHMHESQEDRTKRGEAVQGPAAKALEKLPLSWWDRLPAFDAALITRTATIQPDIGPGHKKMPKRRARQQMMAPKLQPGRESRDEAVASWKGKRRKSLELDPRVRKPTVQAPVKKPASNVQKHHDTSSSDEDLGDDNDKEFQRSREVSEESPAAAEEVPGDQTPIPEPDKGFLPLEELFPMEAGKPALVNGVCQLCEQSLVCPDEFGETTLMHERGNPYCRGCSIVDWIRLDDHPFAPLLRGPKTVDGVVHRLKAEPHVGKKFRSAFSPPPARAPTGLDLDLETMLS